MDGAEGKLFEFVVGATGDAWRDEFRARLRNVTQMDAALLILEELVNRFHDYHTTLRWPTKPSPQAPAVRPGYVEGVVAVAACRDDMPLASGDVLHHIGETEAEAAFQKQLAVTRGATVYARRQWACDRLLEGPAGTNVTVCVLRRSGQTETFRLERTGWPERESGGLESRELTPDIGYIRIPRWSAPRGEDLTAQFDDALTPFRHKPHLIIDVRGNGGGIDALADSVTGRFLRAPIVSSISFHRKSGTDIYEKTVEIAHPRGAWRYEGRTAVLTDEGCASACEHFVSGMEASGVSALVGRPTTGACGWPKNIALPGGATLWCSLTFPFHGKEPSPLHGIDPHLLVLPTLGALRAGPHAVGIFPLGAQRGAVCEVRFDGPNLAGAAQKIAVPPDAPDTMDVAFAGPQGATNLRPFHVSALPDAVQNTKNQTRESAQTVAYPCVVSGRLAIEGAGDYYRFRLEKPQKVVLEVFSRRVGTPMDAEIMLFDKDGKFLQANDDARGRDYRIERDLPAGEYTVRDIDDRGGAAFPYRLVLSPPQPDFDLLATPDAPKLARGASVSLTVKLERRDGFDGDVTVTVSGLPGVIAEPLAIAKDKKEGMLTLTATAEAVPGPVRLSIRGVGTAGGQALSVTSRAIETYNIQGAAFQRDLIGPILLITEK